MGKKAEFHTTLAASRPIAGERPESEEVLLIVMLGNSAGQIFPLSCSQRVTVIGRDDSADIQVLDAEISRRHAEIRCDAATRAFSICDLQSRNGTRVNGVAATSEIALTIGDKIQLGTTTVLRLSLDHEPEAKYARKMFQAALRDGLTGTFNRRYFEERLASEIAFAKRHDAPLMLMLADIDHFKRINDQHGHRAGDYVLERFCQLLASQVRTEDVFARYGGEEFALLCRDTDQQQAAVLAERLRHLVEVEPIVHDGQRIPVTVSIGIAGTRENAAYDHDRLVELADQALYAAKSAGRNRTRTFSG